MKQLTCEMCGSTDLVKQDGVFVCQTCGAKYSIEEAKKMMVDGTVDVSGSTVKVDTSGELANLYQIARRAKDDNNGENAAKYYDMVLMKDPTSWEASFYVVYFKAMECKIAQIESAAISVSNCIDTVLKLIKDNVSGHAEQVKAYTEVSTRVMIISSMLFKSAGTHYHGIDPKLHERYTQEYINNAFASFRCVYCLGNNLDLLFGSDSEANKLAVAAWKQGIGWHKRIICILQDQDKEGNINEINSYVAKIKKYETTYQAPEIFTGVRASGSGSGGCYVATAVYGSYDCPQVWTLRRYRDYTLAETWYGRAFIHTYYAISPTLVKWFGHTDWFKNMWRGKLDRMVSNLQSKGVESTPYEDREW